MMKPYLYAVAAASLLFSHIWVYQHGKDIVQARANKSALEYREKENRLLADLEESNKKRKVITHERIVQVEKVVDQCLDRPLPDDVKRLLNAAGHQI